MILAVIGIVLAGYRSIKEENINIPRQLLLAIGIAIIFSLICFILPILITQMIILMPVIL